MKYFFNIKKKELQVLFLFLLCLSETARRMFFEVDVVKVLKLKYHDGWELGFSSLSVDLE